jgi:uncharacterized protein
VPFDLTIWIVAGLCLAGVIKGATGIGYTTSALPFLVMAVGVKPAMALVLVPAIASNAAVMATAGSIWPTARRFWLFYAGIVPGIPIGTGLLTSIDTAYAAKLLGLMILAYVGLALLKPELSIPKQLERPLGLPAGFCNGVITGLTGSQILPLMPYFMSMRLNSDDQVQAVNLAVSLTSVVLGIALVQTGIMTQELLAASAIGALPAVVGVNLGARIRDQFSLATFRRLSLATLGFLALPLLGGIGPVRETGSWPAKATVATQSMMEAPY